MLTVFMGSAQSELKELKVGDKVPDIILSNFINYSKERAKTSDFRGKLLIIDFWATWCSPCIKAMPELAALQKKYSDKVQFFAVTSQKKEEVIETLKILPSLKGLQLPILYADVDLRKLFPYSGVPHDVIIDENGFVKAITTIENVNESSISRLLSSQKVQFAVQDHVSNFDFSKPLFLDDKGQQTLYHFLVTGYMDGSLSRTGFRGNIMKDSVTGIFATNGLIVNLYRIALCQRMSASSFDIPDCEIILNVKDSSRFIMPKGLSGKAVNDWDRNNAYCVDMIMPYNMRHQMFNWLKVELDNFFNLETNLIPKWVECVVLKDVDKSKVTPGSGKLFFDDGKDILSLNNNELGVLVSNLNLKSKIPIVNETGYDQKLNIQFKAGLTDGKSLIKEFANRGIKAELEYRNIWFIEIRDKGVF